MRKHLPSLNQLKAFEATARHLSFSKAAEELHVTHAAVSHQVKALETYLQVRLFDRLTRSIELTEGAKRYYLDAKKALDIIDESTARFFGDRLSGKLKVSVAPSFASRWLLPRLDTFKVAYPKIEIEVQPSIVMTDFYNSDIDVGIRRGDGCWPDLNCIKLFEETLIPVAAPGLIKTLDHTFFQQANLLGVSTRLNEWDDWISAYTGEAASELDILFFPARTMALDAAIGGSGIVLEDYRLVESDVLAGRLVVLDDFTIPNKNGFYVSCKKGPIIESKVQAFSDWMTDQFAD